MPILVPQLGPIKSETLGRSLALVSLLKAPQVILCATKVEKD